MLRDPNANARTCVGNNARTRPIGTTDGTGRPSGYTRVRTKQLLPVLPLCRPRESEGPGPHVRCQPDWMPAFRGHDEKACAGAKRYKRTTRIAMANEHGVIT